MFRGKYYKHQNKCKSLCIIEGRAKSGDFLQVVTNDSVYHYDSFSDCSFSENGIYLDLPDIKGKIAYSELTPLKSDIMGFFRFFPMQCRHSIFSMYHELSGGVEINGEFIDFDQGKGYIEGDSGYSFPKKYLWLHCNDFTEKCSIMVSVADIPFLGFHFTGCICAVIYKNKEYRLATYNGVKIEKRTERGLILTQKSLKLEIEYEGRNFVPLKMPIKSKMTAITRECNSSFARFKFFENGNLLFEHSSENASFEYFF